MTRSTPEDDVFKRRVAKEFLRVRDHARDQARMHGKDWSMEAFVRSLGITRAAFHKLVAEKAIPSLRVLSRARKYWGVQLSYGDLGDRYIKTKKKDPRQGEFKFSIADISSDQIEIKKVSPKGECSVELLIRIDFSKSA